MIAAQASRSAGSSMKITGTSPIRSGGIRRGGKTARAGDENFADHLTAEQPTIARTPASGPAAPVDALIALQEVPDATADRKRAVGRGHDLLDRLDEIRHGLLIGALPADRLLCLSEQLRLRQAVANDNGLAEILREIELRVAVELAKLSI